MGAIPDLVTALWRQINQPSRQINQPLFDVDGGTQEYLRQINQPLFDVDEMRRTQELLQGIDQPLFFDVDRMHRTQEYLQQINQPTEAPVIDPRTPPLPGIDDLPHGPVATQQAGLLGRIGRFLAANPALTSALMRGGQEYLTQRGEAEAAEETQGRQAMSNLISTLTAGKTRPGVTPVRAKPSRVAGLLGVGADVMDITGRQREHERLLAEAREQQAYERQGAHEQEAYERQGALEQEAYERQRALEQEAYERVIKERELELEARRVKIAEASGKRWEEVNQQAQGQARLFAADAMSMMESLHRAARTHAAGGWFAFGPRSLSWDHRAGQLVFGDEAAAQASFDTTIGSLLGDMKKVFGEDRLTNEDRLYILSNMPERGDGAEVVAAKIQAIDSRLQTITRHRWAAAGGDVGATPPIDGRGASIGVDNSAVQGASIGVDNITNLDDQALVQMAIDMSTEPGKSAYSSEVIQAVEEEVRARGLLD